jgi:hypothetical protein
MTSDEPGELAGRKGASSKTVGDSKLSERPHDLADPKALDHASHLPGLRISREWR